MALEANVECKRELLGDRSGDTSRQEKLGILAIELSIRIEEEEVRTLQLDGCTLDDAVSEPLAGQGVREGHFLETNEIPLGYASGRIVVRIVAHGQARGCIDLAVRSDRRNIGDVLITALEPTVVEFLRHGIQIRIARTEYGIEPYDVTSRISHEYIETEVTDVEDITKATIERRIRGALVPEVVDVVTLLEDNVVIVSARDGLPLNTEDGEAIAIQSLEWNREKASYWIPLAGKASTTNILHHRGARLEIGDLVVVRAEDEVRTPLECLGVDIASRDRQPETMALH